MCYATFAGAIGFEMGRIYLLSMTSHTMACFFYLGIIILCFAESVLYADYWGIIEKIFARDVSDDNDEESEFFSCPVVILITCVLLLLT